MSKQKDKPIVMWAVFTDCAICHITVPDAPYLSTDIKYTIEEYKKIMQQDAPANQTEPVSEPITTG